MSKFWKYLDVPDHKEIGNEVYQYTFNHKDELLLGKNPFVEQPIYKMLDDCPLLQDFLINRDLIPKRLAIIICSTDRPIVKHRDTDGDDPDCVHPHVRILWPVRNCQGSKTQIWKVPIGDGTSQISPDGVMYTALQNQEYELEEEFELLSPVVFDASCVHSVEPNMAASGPRISFTIGFDRDLPISKSVKSWFDFQR